MWRPFWKMADIGALPPMATCTIENVILHIDTIPMTYHTPYHHQRAHEKPYAPRLYAPSAYDSQHSVIFMIYYLSVENNIKVSNSFAENHLCNDRRFVNVRYVADQLLVQMGLRRI